MLSKKVSINKSPKVASRAGLPALEKKENINVAPKSAATSPVKKLLANPISGSENSLNKKSPIAIAAKSIVNTPSVKSAKATTLKSASASLKSSAASKLSAKGQAVKAKSPNGKLNGKDLLEETGAELPKAGNKLKESLAKKAAGSSKASLRIFQIYYENWQRDLLDVNFSGLDNSKSKSELLEFAVFEQLSKSEHVKDAQLWGALSWRFAEKTGMSGTDWVKNIEAHSGYDVYYCNPFPHNEALFHNYWLQGITTHPQFFPLCKAIFEVTGLPIEELTSLAPSDQFSSANYFVGTPKFWNTYIPWVQNVLTMANKKLPPKIRDLMHSKQADDRGIHNGATYVPFIVERLLPVFLKTAGKSLKAYKIALPERERELNVHLKLLREMKDVAHRTKSAWLAVCWANYRNLYLTQVSGKEWTKKYLPAITPTEVKFS